MSFKIILSRKGFDATAGGIASPVINNQFVSFPIPEGGSGLFYKELQLPGSKQNMLHMLRDLGAKQYSECHMDPNLNPQCYGFKKEDGWMPAFGQDDIALTHLLETKKVNTGDVFLFFGKFRMAEYRNATTLQYIPSTREFHAIYGFLEIGEIVRDLKKLKPKQKALYKNHPHVKQPDFYKDNSTLFLPAEKSMHGFKHTVGTFQYSKALVLTHEKGKLLTDWQMPKPFWGKQFSYNLNIGTTGKAKSPGRGQEMVSSASEAIMQWIKAQIEVHSISATKN